MKYPDDILNQIVIGDCVEVMRDIPDNTVQMCVTSPPYWGKRDYQSDGTGTTAKRAEELRRSFIHIDLAFGDLARERIAQRMLI